MADFSFEVESKVYADLDQRLAEGDWSFDQGDAEAYGELAGRAGGTAACVALQLGPASALCGQVAGAITKWLVDVVWSLFSGLFGDNEAERHAQWEVWRAWYDAQIVGIRQAYDTSQLATQTVVAKLAELAAGTIGTNMTQGDWISLLHAEGAKLIECDREIVTVIPAACTPQESQSWFLAQDKTQARISDACRVHLEHGGPDMRAVKFKPYQGVWPCDVSRYSIPVEGAGWWLALFKRDPPESYDRTWIEPAFATQKAYLDSLRVAAMKAAARVIAIGAAREAARVAAEAGVKIEAGPIALFEVGPDYDAPPPGWGVIGLFAVGALGLVIVANR